MIVPNKTKEQQTDFYEIYERIQRVTGTRTQVELAIILEIRQSSISDGKKRNSIPSDWILTLFRKLGTNPDWLETGAGPMYLRTEKGYGASEAREGIAPEHMTDPQASPIVVPVYSTQCRWENESNSPESGIIGRVALPRSHAEAHIRVYKTDSDALAPFIRKGAYLGVDTAQQHPASGDLFAVTIPPEGVLFRRLWSQASPSDGTEANQLILRAEQPGYPDTILSTEAFQKRVGGRLVWCFQTC